MKSLLTIGPEKDTIIAARAGIMDILKANVADAVQLAALEAFQRICAVSNTTVSDCNFMGGEPKED